MEQNTAVASVEFAPRGQDRVSGAEVTSKPGLQVVLELPTPSDADTPEQTQVCTQRFATYKALSCVVSHYLLRTRPERCPYSSFPNRLGKGK